MLHYIVTARIASYPYNVNYNVLSEYFMSCFANMSSKSGHALIIM